MKRKKRLRSPIWWFGGKGNLVSKLLQYVPKHIYYLEVFGGGASLLFAKEPAPFEVYNDIDSGLVNFFRVLRDKEKFEEFYRKVCLTPYAREEFYYCRNTWQECEDEVERAYRWYVVARMSFSGCLGRGWCYNKTRVSRGMPMSASRWLSIIEMLPEIHQRIMRVQIEYLDWKECLEKYKWDFEKEFIYLDPPYLPETRRSGKYQYEMTYEDHEELVEYLLTNHRRVMLSGYPNKLYERLEENGWKRITWNVGCYAVGRTQATGLLGEGITHKKNQRRPESIWINYDPETGLPLQETKKLF